uniref:7TM_GPCR_Srx domain-containing protein n=1 Tax=Panagrellus redivivus TaxID=6233 RepID=A0A7E4VI08_PANRE
MGLERMCAVVFPTIFRKFVAPNINLLIVFASIFASGFLIVPTTITLIWPTSNVRWSCGRKAAYGADFGLIDYSFNVIGFTAAFVFNIVALVSSMKVQQSGRNMAKLKCYTAIAFLSTLLISIPNLLSFINVFIGVSNILLTPAPILACANGAVQFVVYLTFNPEFLQRFFQIITFNRVKNIVKVKPPPNFTQVPSTSTRVPSTASKILACANGAVQFLV